MPADRPSAEGDILVKETDSIGVTAVGFLLHNAQNSTANHNTQNVNGALIVIFSAFMHII